MSAQDRMRRYRLVGAGADLVLVQLLVPPECRDLLVQVAAQMRTAHRTNDQLWRLQDRIGAAIGTVGHDVIESICGGRRDAQSAGHPMFARERERLLVQAVRHLADRPVLDAFVALHAGQPAVVRRAACLFDLGTRMRGQAPAETAHAESLRRSVDLAPTPFFPDGKPAWEADLVSAHWGFTSAFETTRLRRLMAGENI
jgi:hypothetical protein